MLSCYRGITYVKSVNLWWYNWVENHAQFIHRFLNFICKYLVIPTRGDLYPRYLRLYTASLYTAQNQTPPDRKPDLYPQSTLPTTTTTIYINRRGTI